MKENKEDFKKEFSIAEGVLVMLRLSTKFGYSNTWWRVMFCDNDSTFIGRLERRHWLEYDEYEVGDDVRWDNKIVQGIYNEGEVFCSDHITICNCKGLCHNK